MEGELDMVTDMLVRVGYVDYGNSEKLGALALKDEGSASIGYY